MKKYILFFILFTSTFNTFSQTNDSSNQENELHLPQVVTYIPSSLENKITYTSEELQQFNFQDLPQLLESTGIQLLSYGTYGLEQKPSIRGFTDETVRVVIDGVCVNNPQTGTFDFSTINLNSIKKIEIIKGGYTEGVEDEDAVGGVIYISTKEQNLTPSFSTNTKFISYLYPNFFDTFSQNLNFTSPITESTFFSTDINATSAKNAYRENDASVHDLHSNIQLTNYFGNGNSISIIDSTYIGDKNLPGPRYSQDKSHQNDFNNNLTLSLFTPNLSKLYTLKSNIYWLSNTRFYNDVSENSKHYINSIKYNLTFDFYPYKNLKEQAGITIDYTNLKSTNDGLHNQFTGVLKETSKISLSPIFSINIPLAIKFSGKNFAFTPKIAFAMDLKKLSFILDAYRIIQFPNMDDLYWIGFNTKGNPDLKPEDGFGTEFCINLFNSAKICFFATYYNNKIKWAFSNNQWMPQNVASAFYSGIDLNFDFELFNDLLKFNFNGEYLYNRLLDKKNEYEYGKRIMWTPDFTASFSTILNLNFIKFIFTSNYTGKRFISNLNLSYLKPYTLLNFSAELTKIPHFTPYIKIDNIMDTKYESIENYPMPGISLTFGIKSKI